LFDLVCNLFSDEVLKIITGKGIHSEGGMPKIKPEVTKLLKKKKDKHKGKDKLVLW